MASSQQNDEENFARIHLLLMKPCRKLMKAFFERLVKDTSPGTSIDGFLNTKQKQILKTHHGKYNMWKYFPPNQQTDVDAWDIGMLFHMTNLCPSNSNTVTIYYHVHDIKHMRDTLCHQSKPLISESEYTCYRQRIQDFINDVLQYLKDQTLQDEIDRDVQHIDLPIEKELIDVYKDMCGYIVQQIQGKKQSYTIGDCKHAYFNNNFVVLR